MINLILASVLYAHPGRTDSAGCHAGKLPRHCNHGSSVQKRSTTIDFEAVDIEGSLHKPKVKRVHETKKVDPCESLKGNTTEYNECSLNLSYENILDVCELVTVDPILVKPYLDILIETSLSSRLYETNGKNGWQYELNEDGTYTILSAPKKKYIGRRTRTWKQSSSIASLQKEKLLNAIHTEYDHGVFSKDGDTYTASTWYGCFSDSVSQESKHNVFSIITKKSKDSNRVDQSFLVEQPKKLGLCYGQKGQNFSVKGKQSVCSSGWKWSGDIQKTRYTLDMNHSIGARQDQKASFSIELGHPFTVAGIWASGVTPPSRIYFDMTDSLGDQKFLYTISPTMMVYIDKELDVYGVFYRRTDQNAKDNVHVGRTIVDYRYALNAFHTPPVTPKPLPGKKPAGKPWNPGKTITVAAIATGMVLFFVKSGS